MTLTLLERVKANAGVTPVESLPVPQWDPDLIPEVDLVEHRPDPLDQVLAGLDILEAYAKWCGKMTPQPGTRRESIKVSCPNPAHPDTDPSAWVNLDKQTWYCGGCAEGGDVYDIAAWHFGFDVPGYKTKDQFPELRKAMAADLGVTLHTTPTGRTVSYVSEQTGEIVGSERNKPELALAPSPTPDTENVIAFPQEEKEEIPSIDWRAIVEPGTFLYNYLEDTDRFDLPPEFHFWCGIQMLGAAAGKLVCLDSVPDIHPNFYVCLLGPSGIGKSRASTMAKNLLDEALTYEHDKPDTTGTYLTPMPGSGESLLDIFSAPERNDPEDEKRITRYCSVRGLVSFAEFSTLAAKASRAGNTLKTSLIELYDGQDVSQKSRTSGLIVVKDPFCQVIATTQPRVIKEVMTAADADSGFVNRWIFACGPARTLTPYYTDTFDPTPHVEPLRKLRAWCCTGRRMRLTGEALAVWEKFFRAEITKVKMASDDLPLLTRCDLTFFKLMLAFAINDRSAQPTVRHVEAAISLWPYLQASYAILSKEIGMGEVDACCQAVLENIARHRGRYGKPPSVSDLHQRYMKRRFARETILKALHYLVSLEEIEEISPEEGKGRPVTRYDLRSAG